MYAPVRSAAKDVIYLRKLVKGLGAPEPGPTKLASDSKSAREYLITRNITIA